MDHLCIIGAGATGVAVLREVIRRRDAARITVLDPRPPGEGIAFASARDWHLCNTSVGTMSVNAMDSRGFARWLQEQQGQDADDNSFVPRRLFNQYVKASYREAITMASNSGIEIENSPEPVVSVASRDRGGVAITGHNGRTFLADAAVLAPGVGQPLIPAAVEQFQEHPQFFDSPYSKDFDAFLDSRRGSRVLVLGTRLSAIDAVKTCLQYGATSVMASPSGHLPAVRSALTLRSPFPLTRDAFTELSASPRMFRQGLTSHLDRAGKDLGHPLTKQISYAPSPTGRLREEIALAEKDANLWQYAIGELIDLANEVWPHFPRRRMLELTSACHDWIKRYVSSMPLINARALADAIQEGALAIRPMPIRLDHRHGGWLADWSEGAPEHFDAIVSAAGHARQAWSWSKHGNLKLGSSLQFPFRVDAKLQVVNRMTERQPQIWALGELSANRYPVVNYMRSSVVQAQIAAESMANRSALVQR